MLSRLPRVRRPACRAPTAVALESIGLVDWACPFVSLTHAPSRVRLRLHAQRWFLQVVIRRGTAL
jgi:hypothetical protein